MSGADDDSSSAKRWPAPVAIPSARKAAKSALISTGIGAIRSGHDLLEAIVFPSASFVPGHEVFNVDTETERLSGVIKSQSKEAVVLVTGPNGEVRIPRSIVRSVTPSTVSLMPEGFDEQLSKSELTDLLAFLQAERTRPKTMAEAKRTISRRADRRSHPPTPAYRLTAPDPPASAIPKKRVSRRYSSAGSSRLLLPIRLVE